MKLIKTLVAIAAMSVSAYAAAVPTYTFSNTGFGGTINNLAFTELTITSSPVSTTTFTDANGNGVLDAGDSFLDSGFIAGVAFKNGLSLYSPLVSGLGVQYQLWAQFNPLAGVIGPGGSILFAGTPATQISFYYDSDPLNTAFNAATLLSVLDPINGGCTLATCILTAGYNSTVSNVIKKDGVNFGDLNSGDGVVVGFNYTFVDANGTTIGTLPQLVGLAYGAPGGQLNLFGSSNGFVDPTSVPEPASMALLGLGLLGLGFNARRKKS